MFITLFHCVPFISFLNKKILFKTEIDGFNFFSKQNNSYYVTYMLKVPNFSLHNNYMIKNALKNGC